MLDNVGNRSASEILSVMTPNGRCVQISGPKDNPWTQPMFDIAKRMLKFRKASQSFHQFTAEAKTDDLIALGRMLESGELQPQIQRTIGLDGVAAAIDEISSGHTRAKIVVVP